MALVVEDGTVVSGATSYETMNNIDQYCQDKGYTSWLTLAEYLKEQAVHRAMLYIEGQSFKGYKTAKDNPLEWPRYDVTDRNGYSIDDDEIPTNLKYALCEASYTESVTSGTLQPDYERGGAIKFMKADVLELEYSDGATHETIRTKINGLLFGLVDDRNKVSRC